MIAWRGDIYYGTLGSGIFKLDKDRLVSIRKETQAGDLKASADYLFTAGDPQFARFDGTDWKTRTFT